MLRTGDAMEVQVEVERWSDVDRVAEVDFELTADGLTEVPRHVVVYLG